MWIGRRALGCGILSSFASACGDRENPNPPNAPSSAPDIEASVATRPQDPSPFDDFVKVDVQSSEPSLTEALKREAARAKKAKLAPYAEFWAEWCPPCMVFRKSMDDSRMRKALAGVYLIQLHADEWGNRLAGTGFVYSVIPAFFELDAEGRPTGRKTDSDKWGGTKIEKMAPALNAFFHPV
jgi:thiol-disulfide isomerase/thioredoxin